MRKWVARLTNVYPSFVDAVRECHPEYDWQEWRFPKVRRAFWSISSNRQRYLLWLGEKLGFRKMEDWYSLKQKDLVDNYGLRPWQQYWRSSAFAAVKECFPKHQWHEWLFVHLAVGFWDLAAIRTCLQRHHEPLEILTQALTSPVPLSLPSVNR